MGWLSSQKVVIMEDVDEKQLSSFTTTLRFGVLGEAQWFWGLGGVWGREAVFRTSLPPLEQQPPQYYRGADRKRAILLVAARVSSRKFPPKFKLSTWAIWSAFTAKISNSSTKQMCAESGFGAARRSSSWRTLMRNSLSSFTTTLRFGVLGEAQWFWGLGEGFGGGRPF